MTPVGRLAPSPTGVLHLGNARSFLLAWLDIRSREGRLLLRVEDLDGPRVRRGAAEQTLEDLRWLGLDWDGPVTYQSNRLELYREARDRLLENGQAFWCRCTRKDVETAASAPHAGEEGPIYPGTCRGLYPDAAAARAADAQGRAPNLRFQAAPGLVHFVDRCRGPQGVDVARCLGDFVLWKREDEPSYQLAVTVDDAEQGVDTVLRGEDLLSSAARQLQLYRALGRQAPHFAHVPLVVGEDGRRLAKRHGDTSLRSLREQGVSVGTVLGWLAWRSGLRPAPHPCSAADLVPDFELARLGRDPLVWYGDFSR